MVVNPEQNVTSQSKCVMLGFISQSDVSFYFIIKSEMSIKTKNNHTGHKYSLDSAAFWGSDAMVLRNNKRVVGWNRADWRETFIYSSHTQFGFLVPR